MFIAILCFLNYLKHCINFLFLFLDSQPKLDVAYGVVDKTKKKQISKTSGNYILNNLVSLFYTVSATAYVGNASTWRPEP